MFGDINSKLSYPFCNIIISTAVCKMKKKKHKHKGTKLQVLK